MNTRGSLAGSRILPRGCVGKSRKEPPPPRLQDPKIKRNSHFRLMRSSLGAKSSSGTSDLTHQLGPTCSSGATSAGPGAPQPSGGQDARARLNPNLIHQHQHVRNSSCWGKFAAHVSLIYGFVFSKCWRRTNSSSLFPPGGTRSSPEIGSFAPPPPTFRCKSEAPFVCCVVTPGSRSTQQNSARAPQQEREVGVCACATGAPQPGAGHQQLLKY